jgi:predicted transcriptional regulator
MKSSKNLFRRDNKITEELLIHEEKVIFIIKEYLNKNRCFKINDIIPFINTRLKKFSVNLNYSGIREVLKSLVKKKLIFEGSKLIKDDVLNNENRKKIYEFIQHHPGVYFNRIAKQLNLSNYILAWHLKMLMKFELIRSKYIENHEAFFDINVPGVNDYILFSISKEKVEKIIEYLLYYQEGASKTKLSRDLNMHTSTVSKYLKTLEKSKLVKNKKLSRKINYTLDEKRYHKILREKK